MTATTIMAGPTEAHPAAMLFPMMGDKELRELADDIKANGLIDSILVYDDLILDGRNRLAACTLAGVEPRYAPAQLNGTSPTLFVVSKNLHRRHLSLSQCAGVGARMMPMLREEGKARMRAGGGDRKSGTAKLPDPISANEIKGESRSIAARAMHVGGKTIQMAAAVMERNPALFERMMRDEIKVSTAYKQVMAAASTETATGLKLEPKFGPKRREALDRAEKRRMVTAISQCRGMCRGLAEMKMDRVLGATDKPERRTWARIANECARTLRAFAQKLGVSE